MDEVPAEKPPVTGIASLDPLLAPSPSLASGGLAAGLGGVNMQSQMQQMQMQHQMQMQQMAMQVEKLVLCTIVDR